MLAMKPGLAVSLLDVPVHAPWRFREMLLESLAQDWRLVSFFGVPESQGLKVLAVLAREGQGLRAAAMAPAKAYPALTPDCPQAHLFERELHEQWGVMPTGHPWLKPVRYQSTRGSQPRPLPGTGDFFRMEGEDLHEVAVGPIHAGVIEPGHFRFQCHGEEVFFLEIALGYQHRGVEARLVGGPDNLSLHLLETACGDTTIGHAAAYAQILEGLGRTEIPPRAHHLRALALELERLANHVGDLGAMAGDVGFLPTMSFFGRLRGDFLNLTAQICGNRFGRGLVIPGGAGFDLEDQGRRAFRDRLEEIWRDVQGGANLLFDSPSVRARFEHTGPLSANQARDLGLVGPAARACGLARDVRVDHPCGAYAQASLVPATAQGGDVQARATVRWLEIQQSMALIRTWLDHSPRGPIAVKSGPLIPDGLVVGLTEGWRGEICHVCLTDESGCVAAYKITDPSFHNWSGLALALRGQQISDFPLCNKSFNLSYCGHDL
jgi:Ni,Fe-hydrogenase III large subunit